MSRKLKIACIGAGYFAKFHIEAWTRIPSVELVAICDQKIEKANLLADQFGITKVYNNLESMLSTETLDVIDVITPPDTHKVLCRQIADQGIHIICQKPLAPTLAESIAIVDYVAHKSVRLIVHENWRFQPWYRKIKTLIDDQEIGTVLHTLYFKMRTGDGWPDDAYLNRQPYFRTMPRLLIYETGIHFIDTFRYLLGEVKSVFADLRSLNPHIKGEDCGLLVFTFENGTRAILDANRYNEPDTNNPRYTFGELLMEGNKGSLRMNYSGELFLKKLGEIPYPINYDHQDINFAGDCVFFTQQHIADCILNNQVSEIEGRKYLKNIKIQEALYTSDSTKKLITF